MQILYKGLTDSDFQKIKHCSSVRDIWHTLDAMYASNHSLESKAVQSSFRASCGSTVSELQEADIEEASSKTHIMGYLNLKSQKLKKMGYLNLNLLNCKTHIMSYILNSVSLQKKF